MFLYAKVRKYYSCSQTSVSGELHKTTLTTDWPIYLTTSADKRLLARRRLPVPSVLPYNEKS